MPCGRSAVVYLLTHFPGRVVASFPRGDSAISCLPTGDAEEKLCRILLTPAWLRAKIWGLHRADCPLRREVRHSRESDRKVFARICPIGPPRAGKFSQNPPGRPPAPTLHSPGPKPISRTLSSRCTWRSSGDVLCDRPLAPAGHDPPADPAEKARRHTKRLPQQPINKAQKPSLHHRFTLVRGRDLPATESRLAYTSPVAPVSPATLPLLHGLLSLRGRV